MVLLRHAGVGGVGGGRSFALVAQRLDRRLKLPSLVHSGLALLLERALVSVCLRLELVAQGPDRLFQLVDFRPSLDELQTEAIAYILLLELHGATPRYAMSISQSITVAHPTAAVQ